MIDENDNGSVMKQGQLNILQIIQRVKMKNYEEEFNKTHKVAYPSTLMKTQPNKKDQVPQQEVQYFSSSDEQQPADPVNIQNCEYKQAVSDKGSSQNMKQSVEKSSDISRLEKEWNHEVLPDGVDYKYQMDELIGDKDNSLSKIINLMSQGLNQFHQNQKNKKLDQQNDEQIDRQINEQIDILNIADVEETEEDQMNNFIAYQREQIKDQNCLNFFDVYIRKTRTEMGCKESYKKIIQQLSIHLSKYQEGNMARLTKEIETNADTFFKQMELLQELEKSQKQNSRLTIELYGKNKEIEQLSLQIEQREKVYEELKNNYHKCIEMYGKEKQKLVDEINVLKQENREKDYQMVDFKVQVQMKVDENRSKDQQLKVFQDSLQSDKQLVQQNEVLKQKIRDLESLNQNKDRQRLQLEIQIQKLQREKDNVNNQLHDSQQSYGIKQANLTTLKSKLLELEDELQQEIDSKQELADKYDKLKVEKRNLEMNLSQIGSEFKKIRDADNMSEQKEKEKMVYYTQQVDPKQEREQKLLFDKQMQGFKKVRNQQIKQYLSQTHVNIQNQVNWFQCLVIMVACGSLQICLNMFIK